MKEKKKEVYAVFDIGKSNKKFFLFNKDYKEVYRTYKKIPEIKDEDGFPAEDLDELKTWVLKTFDEVWDENKYQIKTLNFSTYGASFVHLDSKGTVLTPLYNYLKPVDESITDDFYDNYGGKSKIAMETGSPQMGMLNSGMQLFWLKKTKPEVFKKIRYSIHLPQYLSYLFTGIPTNEYTSIGCHTNLWDYKNSDYHAWVYAEGLDRLFPTVLDTTTSINKVYKGEEIKIGVGIHDSSSALLPYSLNITKSFLLVSTGTWSVSFNPSNFDHLSEENILNGQLNYMQVEGSNVKSSRLFLGFEYAKQTKELAKHYNKSNSYHKHVKFDEYIFTRLINNKTKRHFKFANISFQKNRNPSKSSFHSFQTYEEAYHQLMIELIELQVESIQGLMGKHRIKEVYVDGGFAENDVFMKLLAYYLPDLTVFSANSAFGSALGAVLAISGNDNSNSKRFKDKLEV